MRDVSLLPAIHHQFEKPFRIMSFVDFLNAGDLAAESQGLVDHPNERNKDSDSSIDFRHRLGQSCGSVQLSTCNTGSSTSVFRNGELVFDVEDLGGNNKIQQCNNHHNELVPILVPRHDNDMIYKRFVLYDKLDKSILLP